MSRSYVESRIDFQAIGADLAATEPEKITGEEVLERLAPQILAAHARGVTPDQIRDRLKAHKIVVSAGAIAGFIRGKSETPGKTPPAPGARKASAEPGERQDGLASPPPG